MHEKINNTEALADFGGRLVHINGGKFYRSMTVAYKELGNTRYQIAISVVHPNDQFERKIGTKMAIEHFKAGRTIIVPRDKFCDAAHQFRQMFGFLHANA